MTDKIIPIQKNDDITLHIDALGSDGQGIGRVDGYAVFIAGALPGELVRAHVIKTTASYGVAKLLTVEEAAKTRVKPACPAYPQCGGCTLQHLDYAEQLRVKRDMVNDALQKLGHISDFEISDTLGMDSPLQYRNKGSFPYANCAGMVQFGFFAPRSHRLVPLEDCMIQHPSIVEAARCVRTWARDNGISVYDEQTHHGTLRHCMTRVTTTGEVMVVIVTHGKLGHKEALLDILQKGIPELASVYHNRNDERTNVIFGNEYALIWGKEAVLDEISGLQFSVSPASFLQVNPRQTEKLYAAALDALGDNEIDTLFDVYCGIGTISLLAAQKCKMVIGIENVPAAVEDAKANALRNKINNAEFICGDAENMLPELMKKDVHPDAIIVDPPRKGCEMPALQAIADSKVPRIVYVSCNPATLARDCAFLQAAGYKLVKAQPVDMFPHTTHVETVVLMSCTKG